ncbi:MAG: hypothetical protein ACI9E1_001269 [Cryomorphaceae bacterium]|jgi:hypothetical protein
MWTQTKLKIKKNGSFYIKLSSRSKTSFPLKFKSLKISNIHLKIKTGLVINICSQLTLIDAAEKLVHFLITSNTSWKSK